MNRRNLLVIGTVLLCILIGGVGRADACMCARVTTCERYNSASAIFVGEAIEIIKQDRNGFRQESTVFSVKEVLFGPEARKIPVQNKSGFSCDVEFKIGQTYLIFAGGDEKDGFGTGFCNGNLPIEYAGGEIEQLRKLRTIGNESKVGGLVVEEYSDPTRSGPDRPGAPDIPVTITNIDTGHVFRTATDEEGRYEVTVKPGRYKTSITPPQFAEVKWFEENAIITVSPGGCSREFFALSSKSSLRGVVVDAQGAPIEGVRVELVLANTSTPRYLDGKTDKTAADGSFEIDKVPEGSYTLSVNFGVNPEPSRPFPTTFFPGVSERKDAQVFKFEPGSNFEGLKFRLPLKLQEGPIVGKVVWEDGSPADGVRIRLFDNAFPGHYAGCFLMPTRRIVDGSVFSVSLSLSGSTCDLKSGPDGSFRLVGYLGRMYRLKADIETIFEGRTVEFKIESDPFRVDNSAPIRLVLKKILSQR